MQGCQTESIFVVGFDRLFEQTFAIISKYTAARYRSARDFRARSNRIGVSRARARTRSRSSFRADRARCHRVYHGRGEGEGRGGTGRKYVAGASSLSFFLFSRRERETLSFGVDRLSRRTRRVERPKVDRKLARRLGRPSEARLTQPPTPLPPMPPILFTFSLSCDTVTYVTVTH